MTHFREVCVHGVIHSQCRCPAPNKAVRIVPCSSPKCAEQDDKPLGES